VSSFGHAWLEAFATAHTDVPVGVLTTASPTTVQLDAWQVWAEEVHAQVFLVSPQAVAGAHQRGMTVSGWTANTPAALRRAVQVGVDAVITDFTALVPQVATPPAPPVPVPVA
jgi:glycerophosphoryl diester phosphodiesterase